MKNIAYHIETLLGRHDYVIIPDFGGFVLQEKPATINSDVLTAPFTSVSFNPLMKNSDGLLAIEVSRSKNINYREAVMLIKNEIRIFKDLLSEKTNVSVGQLGSFSLTSDDKMIFTANDDLNFIPINFGLKNVHYVHQEPMTTINDDKQTIVLRLPAKKTLLKYAAVGMLLLGLGFSAPKMKNSYKTLASFNPFSNVETKNHFSLPPLTLPLEKVQIKEQEITFEQAKNRPYNIIIGAYQDLSKAKQLKESYGKDFSNIEILTGRKYHKVCISSFENRAKAYRFLRQIKREYPQFRSAWIFKQ